MMKKRIAANKGLHPKHRSGKLSDLIPSSPFVTIEGPQDTSVGLRLAPITAMEWALDIPLRLAAPLSYHAPAINDVPMAAGAGSSLAVRLVKLKATNQVPQHWAGEKEGLERDYNPARVIRDLEIEVAVARRSQNPRQYVLSLFSLGALHYNAANRRDGYAGRLSRLLMQGLRDGCVGYLTRFLLQGLRDGLAGRLS